MAWDGGGGDIELKTSGGLPFENTTGPTSGDETTTPFFDAEFDGSSNGQTPGTIAINSTAFITALGGDPWAGGIFPLTEV